MPTITSTPVQVPSNGQYLQFTNQTNPFYVEIGSNLYQVLFSGQGTSPANKIGIFKRAAASVGGPWTEKDAANSPDQGLQSGYGVVSVNGTVITICYLQTNQFALRICQFDTATDTYEAPGPVFNLANPISRFAFVKRSDSTFVVVAASVFRTFYLTYSGGAWGSATENIISLSGGLVLGGVIDSSDRIHLLWNTFVAQVDYVQLSASYVLGTPTTIVGSVTLREGGFPSIYLWDATHVAIGYVPTTGAHAFTVSVTIATPLNAPVFTESFVYAQDPAAGFSEKTGSVQFATGLDGKLNVFFTDTNFLLPMNQIKQGVFDGSAWSVSVFYDTITTPATNGLPGNTSRQVIRTIQGLQLSGGWTLATALVINNVSSPPATFNSGEFLEAAASPPIPPTPPPPSGPGTVTCQITIVPAGAIKTLRYQIPQKRWFSHDYND